MAMKCVEVLHVTWVQVTQ